MTMRHMCVYLCMSDDISLTELRFHQEFSGTFGIKFEGNVGTSEDHPLTVTSKDAHQHLRNMDTNPWEDLNVDFDLVSIKLYCLANNNKDSPIKSMVEPIPSPLSTSALDQPYPPQSLLHQQDGSSNITTQQQAQQDVPNQQQGVPVLPIILPPISIPRKTGIGHQRQQQQPKSAPQPLPPQSTQVQELNARKVPSQAQSIRRTILLQTPQKKEASKQGKRKTISPPSETKVSCHSDNLIIMIFQSLVDSE